MTQRCTYASVAFEDSSVADLFEELVDTGLKPHQFGRIWIHTHPGTCAEPSRTDEATFARVFSAADWALMFILARGGSDYARIRMGQSPNLQIRLKPVLDCSMPFSGSDFERWASEYTTHVVAEDPFHGLRRSFSRRAIHEPVDLNSDTLFERSYFDDADWDVDFNREQ